MPTIKVKWGKETYDVEVDLSSTMQTLKEQLQAITKVPADKQKIMGLKPAAGKPETKLADAGVTAGKTIMLIGSAEGTTIPTTQAAETEDENGGHSEVAATSNGLTNIANTCYMNSAIQLIRTMPEIKESLVGYAGSDPIARQLGALLQSLDETKEAVTPISLWTALISSNPTFGERDERGVPMQQDAQEALNVFLRSVSDALPPKYARLFSGTLHKKLTCVDDPEDTGNESEVPFTMLTCNLAGEVQTLEAGLDQAFNETFTARSEKLGREEANFKSTSRISVLPEYVIVHMVRFSWRNDIQKKAKILKPITFPITLDLVTLVTDDLKEVHKPYRGAIMERRDKEAERRKRGRHEAENEEEAAAGDKPGEEVIPTVLHNESGYYELCGVISHKGRSADGGHYVYWGKKTNQWLIFDDNNVAGVSEEDVKRLRGVGESHIAYCLLYRSRDPVTRKPALPM